LARIGEALKARDVDVVQRFEVVSGTGYPVTFGAV
jgi:hypothetical protein